LIVTSFSDIVAADVKSQSGSSPEIVDEEKQVLLADPHEWKGEIVRLKNSVEMRLTSLRKKIQDINEHILYADENISDQEFTRLHKELSSERTNRVNSIRFLHALESKLIEVNSIIRKSG
jgi:hypothetical protein